MDGVKIPGRTALCPHLALWGFLSLVQTAVRSGSCINQTFVDFLITDYSALDEH